MFFIKRYDFRLPSNILIMTQEIVQICKLNRLGAVFCKYMCLQKNVYATLSRFQLLVTGVQHLCVRYPFIVSVCSVRSQNFERPDILPKVKRVLLWKLLVSFSLTIYNIHSFMICACFSPYDHKRAISHQAVY